MLLSYGYKKVEKKWNVEENPSSIFLRLYWIKGGEAVYTDGKSTMELKQEYLYAFPTNVIYTITHNERNPLCCVYLHIEIAPFMLSKFLEIDIKNDKFIYHLFSLFAILGEEKIDIYGVFQEELARCIFVYLNNLNIFQKANDRIVESMDYMFKNMEQNISINELAKISGYHPKYYIKMFLENIGITPYQYMLQYKMKHALTLLQNGCSVTETAIAIGYSDEKSFSKMFKKVYGILPSKVCRNDMSL